MTAKNDIVWMKFDHYRTSKLSYYVVLFVFESRNTIVTLKKEIQRVKSAIVGSRGNNISNGLIYLIY